MDKNNNYIYIMVQLINILFFSYLYMKPKKKTYKKKYVKKYKKTYKKSIPRSIGFPNKMFVKLNYSAENPNYTTGVIGTSNFCLNSLYDPGYNIFSN